MKDQRRCFIVDIFMNFEIVNIIKNIKTILKTRLDYHEDLQTSRVAFNTSLMMVTNRYLIALMSYVATNSRMKATKI
jgi:hypothetical protein